MTTSELCKYLQKRAYDIKNTHPISANLILTGVCEIELLEDRLEQYEKALDKACYYLSIQDATFLYDKEDWKEWCLNENK